VLKGTDSLAKHFRQYFQVVSADTAALRRCVYAIRYRVYCEELGLEDPAQFPDGLEHDAYDEHARHALLLHRPSGEHVGCVRLILADGQNPDAPLPFEQFCRPGLRRTLSGAGPLQRSEVGEISRLAVQAKYRRRSGELESPNGMDTPTQSKTGLLGAMVTDTARTISSLPNIAWTPESQRRIFPHIAPILYFTGASMALREGLSMAFVMMEPRLARHLRRYGILFHQVGDIVEYHGQRGPFRISREDLLDHLRPQMHEFLAVIEEDLSQQRPS